jgi:hypothetical protein
MSIHPGLFSCGLLFLSIATMPPRLYSQTASESPRASTPVSAKDINKSNEKAVEKKATKHRTPPGSCYNTDGPIQSLDFLPDPDDPDEPATGRTRISPDYFVIEYNATTRQTWWRDYQHVYDPGYRDYNIHPVKRNGSFLPIVYTREKIAVHVCNLRFNDQLTVTTSPIGVPEGGADIRGATATTPLPSLASTLDALQNATVTGTAVPESGLGFGQTGIVTLSVVPGVAPGVLSPQNGSPVYTDAVITASGKQLAELLFAVRKNADDLVRSIAEVQRQGDEHHGLPGSIAAINKAIGRVDNQVESDTRKLKPYFSLPEGTALSPEAMEAASNLPAFDADMTAVQTLAGQLTILSGSLSAQGFGTRAVNLQNSYAGFSGVLDLITLGRNQRNCQSTVEVPPAPKPAPAMSTDALKAMSPEKLAQLSVEELKDLTTAQVQAINGLQLTKLSRGQLDALAAPRPVAKPADPRHDQPTCGAFELDKYNEFYKSYTDELIALKVTDPDNFEQDTGAEIQRVFETLRGLRRELEGIDQGTGKIFEQMNAWHRLSSVEQTDLLTPPNNNTLLRVSIVVQPGYTPFTLTNNPAPTAPTAPVTASTASASTNTPAHTVKTVVVEVHRLANFNLAGGVMVIHVPTSTYSVVTGTPATPASGNPALYNGTCNGQTVTLNGVPSTSGGGSAGGGSTGTSTPTYTAPSYTCIVTTQKTDWQVAGMAGITWYPAGRDYFPRRKGYTNYPRNFIPGVLVASSVTSLGSGFGGLSFEPLSGINFFAGVASANRNVLPAGVLPNGAQAAGYVLPSVTQVHVGFSAGIAFDLSVFTQLFSKSTPAGGLP